MVLIDTSIWIKVLSDKQGNYASKLYKEIAGRDIVLTRFQQLELLQGSRNEKEWGQLSEYLDGQDYLEMQPGAWQSAARLYFELRKTDVTVRSPIDCCIAQIAMDYGVLLIHNDRDFDAIGKNFPLQHLRWTQ